MTRGESPQVCPVPHGLQAPLEFTHGLSGSLTAVILFSFTGLERVYVVLHRLRDQTGDFLNGRTLESVTTPILHRVR